MRFLSHLKHFCFSITFTFFDVPQENGKIDFDEAFYRGKKDSSCIEQPCAMIYLHKDFVRWQGFLRSIDFLKKIKLKIHSAQLIFFVLKK